MMIPDFIPAKLEPYATFVPHRTPEFKVHRDRGKAKNALIQNPYEYRYARTGGMYSFSVERMGWVKVAETRDNMRTDEAREILKKIL